MSLRTPTRDLIDAIDRHPDRLEHVTLESGRSMPVLVGSAEEPTLAVFWYGAGGPITDRRIYSPYYQARVSCRAPQNIAFTPLDPRSLGLPPDDGRSLGAQKISGFGPAEVTDAIRAELYESLDRLATCYLRPSAALTNNDRAGAREYRAAFERLLQPALRDVYSAYSPDFFEWLEVVARG